MSVLYEQILSADASIADDETIFSVTFDVIGGGSILNAIAGRTSQSQGDASIGFGSSWSDENGVVHVALNPSALQALWGLSWNSVGMKTCWNWRECLPLATVSNDSGCCWLKVFEKTLLRYVSTLFSVILPDAMNRL